MKGILTALKALIKYAAYVLVIVEIVEFAVGKLEAIGAKQEAKNAYTKEGGSV
jgi:hypothetical protein